MPQPASSTSRVAIIALIGGALVLAVIAWRRQRELTGGMGKHHPAVGKAYLPHHFPPLTAKKPLEDADLSGKVVLVNFWGYWCGPCKTEFPHLMELEKSLRNNPDFRFVSVASSGNPNSDEDDPNLRGGTIAFLAERRADLPTYIDPQAAEQLRIAEISGESLVYPTTIVIDRLGIIRGLWPGYRQGDELHMRAAIDEVLK